MYSAGVPFRAGNYLYFAGLIDAKVALKFNTFCLPRPDLYQDDSMTKKFTTDPDHSAVDQCCGSGMFIPDSNFFPSRFSDPNIFHPGFASQNISILTQNNGFEALGNMIWVVPPGSGSHPGSKGQKCSRSRIPDPDPQHCCQQQYYDIRYYVTQLVRQIHEGRNGIMTYVTVLNLSNRYMRAATVPCHMLRYSPCPTDT